MKIKSITPVGRKPVYDLSVKSEDYDEQQYVLENGVVTHNTGIYYSADNIWIIGRRQVKEGTEISGYEFVIVVDKSRFVKEKSKLPVTVMWDSGIDRYSGLLDIAQATGHVVMPKKGYYQIMDFMTGELAPKNFRKKELMSNVDFWEALLSNDRFKQTVEEMYGIGKRSDKEIEIEVEGEK